MAALSKGHEGCNKSEKHMNHPQHCCSENGKYLTGMQKLQQSLETRKVMALLGYSATTALQQRGESAGESLEKDNKNNLRYEV